VSNFLAIATVTAALRQLVATGIVGTVPGADVVTARPDGKGNAPLPDRGVNVYLYQVVPNAAWRNADLPTRNSNGGATQRPTAALDLHYLLTFYGDDGQLEPQRLLGAVARTLHAHPVLPRPYLSNIKNTVSFAFLATSDLAESVELVRFTPMPLSLDEMSKLWLMFSQTPYSLSVAYQASVVLIESQTVPEPTLPVLDRNVYVLPFRRPIIERIESASATAGTARLLVMGDTLRIRGLELRGEVTRVRIGENEAAPKPSDVTATRIELPLAAFPAGALRAGAQGAQVVQPLPMGTPPLEHRGFESNVAAFVLHPTIVHRSATSAQVTLEVDPPVGERQRVLLLLNRVNAPTAYSFTPDVRAGVQTTLTFAIIGVQSGTYFVRVQVDGADSPLDLDPASPSFGPTVVVPP
jgi:uncharacterized protein DUF4255